MPWIHDGSRVFNGTSPTSWQDLDLKLVAGGGSTLHPTARTLAMIKVAPGLNSMTTCVRPNGSSRNTYVTNTYGHGCLVGYSLQTANMANILLVPTDTSGVIEWQASDAESAEVWLIGFIQPTYSGQLVHASALFATTWVTQDLTQDTGASPTGLVDKAFAYIWLDRDGGTTNELCMRPSTPGRANYLTADHTGSCSQCRVFSVGLSEAIVIKTDGGDVERRADTAPPSGELYLESFVEDDFVDIDVEVYAAAAPPLTWQSLDLSAHVGTRRALVMIEVHMANAGSGDQSVAFRTPGDTYEYFNGASLKASGVSRCTIDIDDRAMLLAETDLTGKVEWKAHANIRNVDLRLIGYIQETSDFVISGQSPQGAILGTMDPISCLITDDIGIDDSTLVIQVTPVIGDTMVIYTGGAFQTGWNGIVAKTDIVAGNPRRIDIQVTDFHEDFLASSPKRWTIEITAENIIGDVI